VNWPEAPTDCLLGDGLYATAHDRPGSIDELCATVRSRVAEGAALYPQGGATALDYGGVPARPGVAIDLRALDRVVDYPAGDMTVTVEAGLTMGRLTALLATEHQRLPLDVPHADQATVGGVFATAACGPRRFGWGRPRDQILGIRFVRADGLVVKGGGRVVKNVAGYDLPKLLTGSLGTLGILAELTLRLRPIPESTALTCVSFPSLADAAEALDGLVASAARPVALELLNPAAVPWFREKGLPVPGTMGSWVVVVGLEDNAASVSWQVDRLNAELAPARIEVLRDVEAGPAWHALAQYPVSPPGRLTLKAAVAPSKVAPLVEALDSRHWATQAHAGNGIVWCHAVATDHDDSLADLLPEVDRVRSMAVEGGGSLTIPHCPTPWKERLRVWGEARADGFLMARIKETLDPAGVMNPGRFPVTIA
jgi:glycolate oxidase FAD binding subunit